MLIIIESVLFYYFLAAVLYTLVLSLGGKFYRSKNFIRTNTLNRIAVLVPCYKEDEVILATARKLLELQYPKELFDVVIIADSLREETIKGLSQLPIIIIPVKFDKSTKTKSLNVAFQNLPEKYDIGIIMDADNIAGLDFLHRINDAYNAGHKVIQGQRVAKNLNSPFAVLDAASEIINNHLFRKGANALGLSSSIIGSGMAYPFTLLKSELSKISAVGGFDKVLQLSIIEKGIKILYLEGAVIFDEKIESNEAFKNQRQRWFSSQLIYARLFFFKGIKMLFKGNFNYFNQSVLYNLFPPRILMLFFLFSLSVLFSAIFFSTITIPIAWWSLLAAYCFALAIALPAKFYNKNLWRAIQHVPIALIKVVQVLFSTRGANKTFIHTKHTQVDVDNSLFNKND